MIKNRLWKHKVLKQLSKYMPAFMVFCGIGYCVHTMFGIYAIPLYSTFGLSLSPFLIMMLWLEITEACIWTKLSVIYSFLSTMMINTIYTFLITEHVMLIRWIFLIIGIVLLSILIYRYIKERIKRKEKYELDQGSEDSEGSYNIAFEDRREVVVDIESTKDYDLYLGDRSGAS